MKKLLLPIFFVLVVVLSMSFLILKNKEQKKVEPIAQIETKNIIKVQEPKNQKDTITVVAVGDMMLGTNYPSSPNYLPPNDDYMSLLKPVLKYLKDGDLTFGNCEGTFSDKPQYAKSCSSDNCYRFSMPTKYVNGFVQAGFDVVSIGNNHIHDLGTYGLSSTVETLKKAGLNFAGITSVPRDTFSIDGVKYGFCAFAPNAGTCLITDYKTMETIVKQLATECDIVIVSFHGGAEGSSHEHVTRAFETFLGQNRGNVYEFAHRAIDAGADLVIGQGPHVTRAVELYKNKFIAYSLGNFCTYRRFNIQGVSGIAPIVKISVDKNGDFIKAHITSVYQDKMTGTKLDTQNRVLKRMQQLLLEDFPETKLKITDQGDIIRTDK